VCGCGWSSLHDDTILLARTNDRLAAGGVKILSLTVTGFIGNFARIS